MRKLLQIRLGTVRPPSLLAIDVQADLLFRSGIVTLPSVEAMMMVLPGRGRAELLRQVYLYGQDVPATDISTFFISMSPLVKAVSRLVFAGPPSFRLRGKEQTPAL